MEANELADALQETEPYYSTDYKLFDQAATMLRQQQAEIEALNALYLESKADAEVLQATVNGNKEVIADWEAEVKSLKELNRLCRKTMREQAEELEDCVCQGGHSEAYLKAKGRLK